MSTETPAFVLGNGKSRMVFEPEKLAIHGWVYGCNALYRTFTPKVLVATDRPISNAIMESGYALKNEFWTRRPKENTGANKIERPFYGMSSGPMAISRAAIKGHSVIYFIGFDLGSPTQFHNNVYSDTEFYKKAQDKATYAGNWISQIKEVAGHFKNTQFVRVTGPESQDVDFGRSNIDVITSKVLKRKLKHT